MPMKDVKTLVLAVDFPGNEPERIFDNREILLEGPDQPFFGLAEPPEIFFPIMCR